MKRLLALTAAIVLIVTGLFIIFFVFNALRPAQKGGLQVTSNIKSTVYLNGGKVGDTPYCKCTQNDTIETGVYEIKIEPHDKNQKPFVVKTEVNPGVLTAVERTFLPGSLASASTITLEKTGSSDPQLFVSTLPEGAMVLVDGTPSGVSPYTSKRLTASEHEVEVQRQGFNKKTLRVRAVNGYKLVVNVILGAEGEEEAKKDTTQKTEITPSSSISPTIPPSVSPTPTTKKSSVTVLQTPNGFLRVRSAPSLTASELLRIKTGETYPVLEKQNNWYKIQVNTTISGWVSGDYVIESTQ